MRNSADHLRLIPRRRPPSCLKTMPLQRPAISGMLRCLKKTAASPTGGADPRQRGAERHPRGGMTMVHFDEAFEVAIKVIRDQLGSRTGSITLIRDVAGQLTAVLDDGALAADEWAPLANTLNERLGPFSPGSQQVLLRKSDLIDEQDVLNSPDRVPVPDAEDTWLVDRLLTNQDWLRKPRLVRSPLPLAVAFSLKGGVGRSTA